MKLRLLREHYKTDGNVWIPKKRFESIEDIKSEISNSYRYTTYRCTICNSLHLSDTKKGKIK